MGATRKHLLSPERVRKVPPSFSWVDHRLIRDGHLLGLDSPEILLYFFLVLVGDRHGLSYYSTCSVARHLKLRPAEIETARASLCERDLIAYKDPLYQVLSLPVKGGIPPRSPAAAARSADPQPIGEILEKVLRRGPRG